MLYTTNNKINDKKQSRLILTMNNTDGLAKQNSGSRLVVMSFVTIWALLW